YYVDPEFGTGCVKITPAHDFNDYEVGQRHDLPKINIFTIDAQINDEAPQAYRGMDRFDARKQIVADLESQGLLVKVEPHKMMVPRGDRSKAVIEPFLTDQWYVKAAPLAEEAVRCVEDGRIRFVPENWKKTYYEWMRNIQDWCISRQIWWGHRIPAWYGPDGEVFVARTEERARKKALDHYGEERELTQDSDVLDTWFSSALWPFSTLGWPDESEMVDRFYPTNVLVTGFDIIFFWVARMVMMGLKFADVVPFHEVYIHGLIRDGEGNKMSKSKGNVLDPLDLIDGIALEDLVTKRTQNMMQPHLAKRIEKSTRKEFPKGIPAFGTDALRFTLASLATQGRDIKFDLGRIEGYRNFCNKLWNATRFVLMNAEGKDCGVDREDLPLSATDRWIVSSFQRTEQTARKAMEEYRFSDAANSIYQFLWGHYCDWYLELVKPVIYEGEGDSDAAIAARRTMIQVLESAIRLLHPLMPYITEELWQKLAPLAGRAGETIMLAPWPESDNALIDAACEREVEGVMSVITGVRNIRGEMNIPPGRPLEMLVTGDAEGLGWIQRHETLIKALAKLSSWGILKGEAPAGSATSVLDQLRLFVPLQGVIDLEAEATRLNKAIAKLESDLGRTSKKLGNENFISRAKPEVVEKERQKAAEFERKLEGLRDALQRIEALKE
ncbi:MAG: valine--tRNA ligase, partial [Magnetococcales bacterium]|nr:valine--tRNA ligase [Magnetococcales bacterium]